MMDGSERIPRILHYCWFGGKPMPRRQRRWIRQWRSLMPDYTLMRWDETNFDVAENPYVRTAYQAGRFAFVSDVARLEALRVHGGIYLDTDMQAVRRFDDLLKERAVFGFEPGAFVATSFMAAEPGHPLIEEFRMLYGTDVVAPLTDGRVPLTNVRRLLPLLRTRGLVTDGKEQRLRDGVVVLPIDRVCAFDYIDGETLVTSETYCIHHCAQSWMGRWTRLRLKVKILLTRCFGARFTRALRRSPRASESES